MAKLQGKHVTKFTPERYHAWPQLIQMDKHASYDEPPNYPFFKGVNNRTTNTETGTSSPVIYTAEVRKLI